MTHPVWPAAPPRTRWFLRLPNWIGDAVMVLPALRALGLEHHICLGAAHPRVLPLYRATGFFSELHPALGFRAPWDLAASLRRFGPQRALVFTRAVSGAVLARLSGAGLRMGRNSFPPARLLTHALPFSPGGRPLWKEYLDLSVAAGGEASTPRDFHLPLEEASRIQASALLGNLESAPVALAPGAAYGPAKRWPLERFLSLSRNLLAMGKPTVVLGGEKEREAGRELAGAGALDLTGRTDLLTAIAVLEKCAVLVSNDSGGLHLARAAGTPVVGVYGSSSPRWTGPEPDEGIALWLGLSCSPCYRRRCPLTGERHLACLRGIEVERVIEETLARGGSRE